MKFIQVLFNFLRIEHADEQSIYDIQVIIILTSLGLLSLATIIALLNKIYDLQYFISVITLLLMSYLLLRLRLSSASKFVSVFGMTILNSIFLLTGNGIYSATYHAQVILIILAALLYSSWMCLFVCFLSISIGLGMVATTDMSLLTSPVYDFQSAWIVWIIQSLVFSIVALMSYLIRASRDKSVETSRIYANQLKEQNQQLSIEINERNIVNRTLQTSEERYRTIVEDQPNFIVRWKPDGTIIFANQNYCDDVKRTKEEVFGANFLEWSSPENVALVLSKIQTLTPDNPIQISTHQAVHWDGTPIWHRWADRAVFDENGMLVAVESIGTDVTVEKELEQKTIQLKVLQERRSFLEDFFGTMTHDLKTPLSVMNTSLYLAQKTDDPDIRNQYLDKIQNQIKHQEAIINNILSILRLDHMPANTRHAISCNNVIQSLQEKLNSKLQAKHITFIADLAPDLPYISGTVNQIERLLLNLIENAINYTPEHGDITVVTESKGDNIVIKVSDTGIGIPPEDIERIFDRFYRAGNTETIDGGTGLGLAIVKRIVDLHNGEISCESVIGKGTTFIVQLPLPGNS